MPTPPSNNTRLLAWLGAALFLLLGLLGWLLLPDQDEKPTPVARSKPSPPRRHNDRPLEWPEDLPAPHAGAIPKPAAAPVTSDAGATPVKELGLDLGTLLDVHKQMDISTRLMKNGQEAARAVEAFCEDQRIQQRRGFLNARPHTKDAAHFLVNKVTWGDNGARGSLEPSTDLTDRMASYKKDWATKVTDEDLAGLDFSWMRELQAYDHWNLMADGPLRHGPPEDLSVDSLPKLLAFQTWAKLRLASALRTGDFAAASSDVRHLAQVLNSDGTLVGHMVAGAITLAEKRAFEAATARGLNTTGWTPPDYTEEDRDRLKRVAFTGPFFFAPGVPPEVMRKAAGCLGGHCASLFEAMRMQCFIAPYYPDDNRATLDAIALHMGCDADMVEHTRHCGSATVDDAFGSDMSVIATNYPPSP